MSKFEIKKGKKDDFEFWLVADNGDIILTHEGYKTKEDCLEGIESVRKNSVLRNHYEIREGAADKYHFSLKAENGDIIGRSKLFDTEKACLETVNRVMNKAPKAVLEDTLKKH